MTETKIDKLRERRSAALTTPSDLDASAAREVGASMNRILADAFALYLKTKNFHWHMTGPHFRDYHLLLDEQADQIFAMTDPIAERVRKIGARPSSRSVRSAAQRILDNDADYVEPSDMLAELREDNASLTASMREAHEIREEHRDIASASLLEVWIDETERRRGFCSRAWPVPIRADARSHPTLRVTAPRAGSSRRCRSRGVLYGIVMKTRTDGPRYGLTLAVALPTILACSSGSSSGPSDMSGTDGGLQSASCNRDRDERLVRDNAHRPRPFAECREHLHAGGRHAWHELPDGQPRRLLHDQRRRAVLLLELDGRPGRAGELRRRRRNLVDEDLVRELLAVTVLGLRVAERVSGAGQQPIPNGRPSEHHPSSVGLEVCRERPPRPPSAKAIEGRDPSWLHGSEGRSRVPRATFHAIIQGPRGRSFLIGGRRERFCTCSESTRLLLLCSLSTSSTTSPRASS